MIYLFSDGYIDQPKASCKSIGHDKLQELLTSIADLPVQKQQDTLHILEERSEKTPQRDDITLLGIRM